LLGAKEEPRRRGGVAWSSVVKKEGTTSSHLHRRQGSTTSVERISGQKEISLSWWFMYC
jgi:hypothetical protein